MAKEKKRSSTNSISFFDSIKTRLISIMLLVAIVPLVIAIIVSYVTSTKKATADAIDALDWQAWYIESSFETVVQKNIVAMQAIAAAPSTRTFYVNPKGKLVSLISNFIKMPADVDAYEVDSSLLDSNGVKLNPQWSASGINENVRVLRDFSSRIYLVDIVEDEEN